MSAAFGSQNEESKSYCLYAVFFNSCTAWESWECVLDAKIIFGTTKNQNRNIFFSVKQQKLSFTWILESLSINYGQKIMFTTPRVCEGNTSILW